MATISTTTIAFDNSYVIVSFVNPVYDTPGMVGDLEAADFVLSLSDGGASLNNDTPTSISREPGTNNYWLTLDIEGFPTEGQKLTVNPVQNAIYYANGNALKAEDWHDNEKTVTLNVEMEIGASSYHFDAMINFVGSIEGAITAGFISVPNLTQIGSVPFFIVPAPIPYSWMSEKLQNIWGSFIPDQQFIDNMYLVLINVSTTDIECTLNVYRGDRNTHSADSEPIASSKAMVTKGTNSGDLSLITPSSDILTLFNFDKPFMTRGCYFVLTASANESELDDVSANESISVLQLNGLDLIIGTSFSETAFHLLNSKLDYKPPVVTEVTVADNNGSINVTFSDEVFTSADGTGELTVDNFGLSIEGGSATLSQSTPLSLTKVDGTNTYTLKIKTYGTPDGNEVITVEPTYATLFSSNGTPLTDVVQGPAEGNLNSGSFTLSSNEEANSSKGANGWAKIEIPENYKDELVSSVTLKLSNTGVAASVSVKAHEIKSYISIESENFFDDKEAITEASAQVQSGAGQEIKFTFNEEFKANEGFYLSISNEANGTVEIRFDLDENSTSGNFGGNKGTAWYKVESDLKDRRSELIKTELAGTYENGLYILSTFDPPLNDAQVDDFVLSLSVGNAELTSQQPNVIISVPESNQYILSLPLAENKPPTGEEIVTVNQRNQLFQDTGDAVIGVNSVQLKDSMKPAIVSSIVHGDNSHVVVSFNEPVKTDRTHDGKLTVDNFELSLEGGTATLLDGTNKATSLTQDGNTYTLGLPLTGVVDGSEKITVKPVNVFDLVHNDVNTDELITVSLNKLGDIESDNYLLLGAQDERPDWVLETDEEYTSGVVEYKGWNPPFEVGCMSTGVDNNQHITWTGLRDDDYTYSGFNLINWPGTDGKFIYSDIYHEVELYNVEGFFKLRIELYPNKKVRCYVNDQFRIEFNRPNQNIKTFNLWPNYTTGTIPKNNKTVYAYHQDVKMTDGKGNEIYNVNVNKNLPGIGDKGLIEGKNYDKDLSNDINNNDPNTTVGIWGDVTVKGWLEYSGDDYGFVTTGLVVSKDEVIAHPTSESYFGTTDKREAIKILVDGEEYLLFNHKDKFATQDVEVEKILELLDIEGDIDAKKQYLLDNQMTGEESRKVFDVIHEFYGSARDNKVYIENLIKTFTSDSDKFHEKTNIYTMPTVKDSSNYTFYDRGEKKELMWTSDAGFGSCALREYIDNTEDATSENRSYFYIFKAKLKSEFDEGGDNNVIIETRKQIDNVANNSPFATDIKIDDDDLIILQKGGVTEYTIPEFDESLSPDLVNDVSGNLMGFGPSGENYVAGSASFGTSLYDKSFGGLYSGEITNYFTEEEWSKMQDLVQDSAQGLGLDAELFNSAKDSGLGAFNNSMFFDMDYYKPGDTLLYECLIDLSVNEQPNWNLITEESSETIPLTFATGKLTLDTDKVTNEFIKKCYNLKFRATDLEGNQAEKAFRIRVLAENAKEYTLHPDWNLVGMPFDCEIYADPCADSQSDIFDAIYYYNDESEQYEQASSDKLYADTGYWIKTNLAAGESITVYFSPKQHINIVEGYKYLKNAESGDSSQGGVEPTIHLAVIPTNTNVTLPYETRSDERLNNVDLSKEEIAEIGAEWARKEVDEWSSPNNVFTYNKTSRQILIKEDVGDENYLREAENFNTVYLSDKFSEVFGQKQNKYSTSSIVEDNASSVRSSETTELNTKLIKTEEKVNKLENKVTLLESNLQKMKNNLTIVNKQYLADKSKQLTKKSNEVVRKPQPKSQPKSQTKSQPKSQPKYGMRFTFNKRTYM